LHFEFSSTDLQLLLDLWLSDWTGTFREDNESGHKQDRGEHVSLWSVWLSTLQRSARDAKSMSKMDLTQQDEVVDASKETVSAGMSKTKRKKAIQLLRPMTSLRYFEPWRSWMLRYDVSIIFLRAELESILDLETAWPPQKVWLLPLRGVIACHSCQREFFWFRPRHNCRSCGHVFCSASTCTTHEIVPELGLSSWHMVRICRRCKTAQRAKTTGYVPLIRVTSVIGGPGGRRSPSMTSRGKGYMTQVRASCFSCLKYLFSAICFCSDTNKKVTISRAMSFVENHHFKIVRTQTKDGRRFDKTRSARESSRSKSSVKSHLCSQNDMPIEMGSSRTTWSRQTSAASSPPATDEANAEDIDASQELPSPDEPCEDEPIEVTSSPSSGVMQCEEHGHAECPQRDEHERAECTQCVESNPAENDHANCAETSFGKQGEDDQAEASSG